MESDDVDKIDGGGEILGGEPSGVALKRHLIIHQLIGLVKKFDVRFG